jgi:hypothetical protein
MNVQDNDGVPGFAGSSRRPSNRNLKTKLLTYAVLIFSVLLIVFWVGFWLWLVEGVHFVTK